MTIKADNQVEGTIPVDDGIQHGLDDNTEHDSAKGGILGAAAGAVVGAVAGGPVGAVMGAVIGGVASAAAVAAVHDPEEENNVTGFGDNVHFDDPDHYETVVVPEPANIWNENAGDEQHPKATELQILAVEDEIQRRDVDGI